MEGLRVRDIMSSDVTTLKRNDKLTLADDIMNLGRIRHLPVMQNDELIGIISIGDLVNWIISAQDATIEQMESYIGGRT